MAEHYLRAAMKWIFYGSESRDHERAILAALQPNFDVIFQPINEFCGVDADGAMVSSLQWRRRLVMDAYRREKCPVVFFDKGYLTGARAAHRISHWRVAVNATQATSYMMSFVCPDDRLRRIEDDLPLGRARRTGRNIVICGSSPRYHHFHGLPAPDEYATDLLKIIQGQTDRPVVYRPKPKVKGVGEIDGAAYDHDPLRRRTYLDETFAVVTHGSNAATDAVLAGVPVFVLGDHPAWWMARDTLIGLDAPRRINDEPRRQWMANLAYCQWGIDEMRTQAFCAYLEAMLELNSDAAV